MTIHSAKGLEFDYVFISGLEEGIFPHNISILEEGIEEERRLAYVALTRARKKLHLSHAQTRSQFGDVSANPKSRFINEMPQELIKKEGIGSDGLDVVGWDKRGDRHGIFSSGNLAKSSSLIYGRGQKKVVGTEKKPAENVTFHVGDKISHKTFGEGIIKEVKGDRLTVTFNKNNMTKKLMKDFAPIVKI